jgi:hypothetical protein
MTFFNPHVPPLRAKQPCLDVQDLEGLWRVNLKIGNKTIFSTFYTRIDQACIVWSVILLAIFVTAQFFPINWNLQATLWSGLTLLGTAVMVAWTDFWVRVERVKWVLYTWVILMLVGLILTDVGIWLGWGEIMIRLCALWLGLSACGYFCTGLGVRSRAMLLVAAIHLLGMVLLSYFAAWQFLLTGSVMACTLLLLAQLQWDMRTPINHNLTPEQQKFNQRQEQLRQLKLRNSKTF